MTAPAAPPAPCEGAFEEDAVALAPGWRVAACVLKVVARGSLLATVAVLLFSDNPPTNPLKQMRLFAGLFAAPEAAAWCIARAFAARLRVEDGALVIEQGGRRIEIPAGAIAAVEPWILPLPRTGLWLRLRSGRRFSQGLTTARLDDLVGALVAGGAPASIASATGGIAARYSRARLANPPGRLDHPVVKFVLYGLVPAVPVFRLHQYITYGGAFGEYYTFGLKAYLLAFGIWWGSWAIAMVLYAAVLRAAIETGTIATVLAKPSWAVPARRGLEILGRLLFFVGTPIWLLLRLR